MSCTLLNTTLGHCVASLDNIALGRLKLKFNILLHDG